MATRDGSRFIRTMLDRKPTTARPTATSRAARELIGITEPHPLSPSRVHVGVTLPTDRNSNVSVHPTELTPPASSNRTSRQESSATVARSGIRQIASAGVRPEPEVSTVAPAMRKLFHHSPKCPEHVDIEIRLPAAAEPVCQGPRLMYGVEFSDSMDELFDQIWVQVQRKLTRGGGDVDALDLEQEIQHHSLQSIVVTSWQIDEGSSTTALGLAARAAAAGQGKVCLVDADFHSADLTKSADLESHPGLAELLLDEASLDEVIVEGPDEHLYFLPAGRNRSSETLAVDARVQQVIRRLEDRFRYIFYDASSLKRGVEAYRWGRFVVNAILVVRAGQRRETILHAINSMHLHGMKLLGTVLNHRVDTIPGWLYPYV